MKTFYLLILFLILVIICSNKKEFFSDVNSSMGDLMNKLLSRLTIVEDKLDNYKKNEYTNIRGEINDIKRKYDSSYKWFKIQEEKKEKNSSKILDNLNV